MYGVDVAATRFDDLDKRLLAAVQAAPGSRVLELGCGSGALAVQLAHSGAQITAVDLLPHEHWKQHPEVNFQAYEATAWLKEDTATYDFCCVQRMLHYVPYKTAYLLLETLRTKVHGQLYLAVTGLESDVGDYYPKRKTQLSQRFGPLTAAGAAIFHIHEPVCLYTPEECSALLQATGWEIEELWVSAFGNIKAICR